ncbi:MAG TPA: hypothetical protein VL172_17110 [Kofleriaceae bacterium]|nr:hypothetical protein [Kofleriaceae bacterium]
MSVIALSGLGLSFTFYTCPMAPAASAKPCCPHELEPPPADALLPAPCCTATNVAVSAPAAEHRLLPDAPQVAALPAPAIVVAAAIRSPAAPVAPRFLLTHGPPPLERTTRLLI